MTELTAADQVWNDDELQEALAGYRYFGVEVAPVFERAQTAREEERDELESKLDQQYGGFADDGHLMAAFKAHCVEHPEAYEPVRGVWRCADLFHGRERRGKGRARMQVPSAAEDTAIT